MQKTYLIILLGLFLAWSSQPVRAQEKTTATVYLINGRVLQGTIINSVFEDYLTLEIDEVTHVDIRLDKIKSIYFGKYTPEPAVKEVRQRPAYQYEFQRGFFSMADVGLLLGQSGSGRRAMFSANMVHGFAFQPHLQAGLGIGVDPRETIATLPVYASLRGTLMKRKVSPYYFLNAGYGFAFKNQNYTGFQFTKVRGGLMLQPGVGYQVHMRNSALLLAVGYRLQRSFLEYTTPDWGGGEIFYSEKRLSRRVSLSLGLRF